jgi:rhodanese-related sulfurtransferase
VLILVVVGVFVLLKQLGQISAAKARDLLRNGALLIDVRTPGEYAAERLPNAINIPTGELAQRIQRHAPQKDRPLLLHCLSGTRSALACRTLRQLGYTNVHNLGSFARARRLTRA